MSGPFDPPMLTGDISYELWKLETLAWASLTDVSKEKQAILIALCLPEKHYSQIKEKVFQEIKLEELNSEDGFSILFDFLDKHLAKDDITDSLEKFGDFENYQRKEGQSLNEYVLMFDFKYRKIERKGLNFPSEILAFRLLEKANITRLEKLLILARMDLTNKSSLYEQAKKVMKLFNSCDSELSNSSVINRRGSSFKDNSKENNYMLCKDRQVNVAAAKRVQMKWGESRKEHSVAGENQQTQSKSGENQSGRKKRINPTGKDGNILTCISCGSYRHLLDACPDSWENMKKKAKIKPIHQSAPEKQRDRKNQLELDKLIAEMKIVTNEVTELKEEIKQLNCDANKDLKSWKEEKESLEKKLELEKQARMRLEFTITELSKQTSKKMSKVTEKFDHSVAQNDHQHRSIIQRTEKLRAISNELNLQFKVLKNKQEITGEIQDERDTFLSSYRNGFRKEERKTGEANKESNQAQEKGKETQKEHQEAVHQLQMGQQKDCCVPWIAWKGTFVAEDGIGNPQAIGKSLIMKDSQLHVQGFRDTMLLNHLVVQAALCCQWFETLQV